MPKYPKEVHPQRGGASGLRIEKNDRQDSDHEQHDFEPRIEAKWRAKPFQTSPSSSMPATACGSASLPEHRMEMIVAMMLMAVAMLPNPEAS